MAIPPAQLQSGLSPDEAYSVINNNFNNSVQDLRDLGTSLSSTLRLALTIPASSVNNVLIGLCNNNSSYGGNKVTVLADLPSAVSIALPQIDLFVDNDANASFNWATGGSLSAGQNNFLMSVTDLLSIPAGTLGAFGIQINNRDIASHTYYFYFRCYYLKGVTQGNFR